MGNGINDSDDIDVSIGIGHSSWFGAPLGPHGAPKGRNFKNFVFERRTAKIWYGTNFEALISYLLKNFGLGPPFGPQGPPKGQNFEIFVFERRTFKIEYSTNFGALISYLLKKFGLGPPFGPQEPLKSQNFEIFVFERRTLKFWYSTNYEALISYLLIILVRGPCLAPQGPRNFLKFLCLNIEPAPCGILGPWFHVSWNIYVWDVMISTKGK